MILNYTEYLVMFYLFRKANKYDLVWKDFCYNIFKFEAYGKFIYWHT